MACEEKSEVDLYIYDLTNGLASLLSPAILGHRVEGIWHTSIVVYGREIFYGGSGIVTCAPGSTQLGQPHEIQRMGETYIPHRVLNDYIEGLSNSTYKPMQYHLLSHNCNHFTEELSQFLCGSHIPKYILEQSARALPPPLRTALERLLDNMNGNNGIQNVFTNGMAIRNNREDSPDFLTLNNQIEEARQQAHELEQQRNTLSEKLARRERKREKKRKKQMKNGVTDAEDMTAEEMAEAVESLPREELARAGPSSSGDDEDREREEAKNRDREPPIVYKDIDGPAEYDKLVEELAKVELSGEERQSLDELQQYLVQGEGSWVLGDEFLAFMGRLLLDETVSGTARVCALRCLAACALRDDVSLVLHQDRRHHCIMNYADGVERLPLEEQKSLALMMCNLFENVSSSEWLLYISEWEYCGRSLSNIRGTTKVAVHATLSEDERLRELGTALMYNVANKEVKTVVFEDVSVELAMALVQLMGAAPSEEHTWRACAALAKLACHSLVPQILQLLPPAPAHVSKRVEEQIQLLSKFKPK